MNLSTELLVGIVLIGIGLLLGAAAYMVLSSRKDDETRQDQDLDALETDEEPEDLPEPSNEEIIAQVETQEDETLIEEQEGEDTALPDPMGTADLPDDEPDQVDELVEAEEEHKEPVAAVEPVPTAPDPEDSDEPIAYMPEPEIGPRIQVATLLRDEVSGKLIVKVGDREYRTPEELRDSGDWTRVEFAASDLGKWIDQPIVRPDSERELEIPDRPKPASMIEQIDAILQAKIEASGQSQLAVRLIEGVEGTARVLIGVHSYEIGEVPDESINTLIREAVAEWEVRP